MNVIRLLSEYEQIKDLLPEKYELDSADVILLSLNANLGRQNGSLTRATYYSIANDAFQAGFAAGIRYVKECQEAKEDPTTRKEGTENE